MTAGSTRVTAKGTRGAPSMFPRKLYKILSEEDPNIIAWADSGRSFQLLDQDAFVEEIMSRFYRHQKLTSFQRQLNLYGFKKQTQGPLTGHYCHPSFQRDRPELLENVRRLYARTPKVSQSPSTSSNKRKSRGGLEPAQRRSKPVLESETAPENAESHSHGVEMASQAQEDHTAMPESLRQKEEHQQLQCRQNPTAGEPLQVVEEAWGEVTRKSSTQQDTVDVGQEAPDWSSTTAFLEGLDGTFPPLQHLPPPVLIPSPSFSYTSDSVGSTAGDSIESSLSSSESCCSFSSVWEEPENSLPLKWDTNSFCQSTPSYPAPPTSSIFPNILTRDSHLYTLMGGVGKPYQGRGEGSSHLEDHQACKGADVTSGGWRDENCRDGSGGKGGSNCGGLRAEEESSMPTAHEQWWNTEADEHGLTDHAFDRAGGNSCDSFFSWGVAA
ncbi:unnamed protein product [Discosporangium mesarthrocarpum]